MLLVNCKKIYEQFYISNVDFSLQKHCNQNSNGATFSTVTNAIKKTLFLR